jgi:Flp pilus assembly protein CpaB
MKSKTLVLMIVAVVCGLVASYMTSKLLADRGNRESDEEKVTVLVAKKNLSYGLLIKEPEHYFVEKQYSVSDAPKNAITSFDDVKNVRLNKVIGVERWVTKEDLMDKNQAVFESQMPPGTRAVSIDVNAKKGVAGFVQPNSKVDVMCTITRGNEIATLTILQNVLVLAAGDKDTRETDARNIQVQTVTLACRAEEAQKLALAGSVGELYLMLRKFGDEDTSTVKNTTLRDLYKGSSADSKHDGTEDDQPLPAKAGGVTLPAIPTTPPAPAAQEKPTAVAVEKPKEPKTTTMVIYNGARSSRQIFVEKDEETTSSIEKSDPETGKKPESKSSIEKNDPDKKPEPKTSTIEKNESDKKPEPKTSTIEKTDPNAGKKPELKKPETKPTADAPKSTGAKTTGS